MIELKTPEQIEKMRECGRIVAKTLRIMSEAIVPGKTTTKMLDEIAMRIIIDEEKARPTFLGIKIGGEVFPAALCSSVNEAVVHGIPDDRPLKEGDIVSLDVGVEKDGWNGDGAWTYPVGTISDNDRKLLNVTRESLMQGIHKAKPGNRMGDISAAVQKYVESHGFSIVKQLVGHGIGRNLHEEPSVPNYGRPKTGTKLREGMVLCIEPMVNAGTYEVVTLPDKWTVVAADGKNSAHFEHMVAITSKGPQILTLE